MRQEVLVRQDGDGPSLQVLHDGRAQLAFRHEELSGVQGDEGVGEEHGVVGDVRAT